MENTEIINYLKDIEVAKVTAMETITNKEETLALLMALHVKKLELLEVFEVAEDKQESFKKLKETLLESVTEMIERL